MSATGQLRSLARRIAGEGHKVSYAPTVDDLESVLSHDMPSAVILDSPHLGAYAEELISRGIRVAGSSLFSRALSDVPGYSNKLLASLGMTCVEHTAPYTISLTGWFNGWGILGRHLSINLTRLMAGNLGTKIPSAATLISNQRFPILSYLDHFEKPLLKASYRGPVSLEGQLEHGTFVVTGFSAHLKPHHLAAYADGFRGSLANLLVSCAMSTPIQAPEIDIFSAGITLSSAPWPYANDNPDGEVDDSALNHVWEVCHKGLVGFVTARGTSIHECHRRILRTISRCKVKTPQYRIDTEGMFDEIYSAL
jgi:hypothetical protein